MIRIGLLGAARIAPKAIIAPVANRNDCDITAVGCRNADKGTQFIQDNNLEARLLDYQAVCTDPDIDMVYCALPPSEHLEWVSLALTNGKAVLCEKPFSMGGTDAKAMVETAKSAGRPVMEAFHYFFHPAFQSILTRFRADEFGAALSFKGVFRASIPNKDGELRYVKKLGGGCLMDLGCYPLHAMRQLIGEPETLSVTAEIEHGVDVALSTKMACGNITAEINCDMRENAVREDYFILECEDVTLRLNSFVAPHRGYQIILTTREGETVETDTGPITYAAQLDNFIGLIKGDRPLLTAEDAMLQMQAIDAIYRQVELR